MKNRKVLKLTGAFLLASSIFSINAAQAEDVLLSKTKLQYKGENAIAQLWGDRQKNGYANKLIVILKREDGTLITGYQPTINGGYNCSLQPIQVKKAKGKTEQLLVKAQQGTWNAYGEYRVIDFEKPKSVTELFSASDNYGVITSAKLQDNTLMVQSIKDVKPVKVEIEKKMLEDISENRRHVIFSKIFSLTPIDVNKDGIQELITTQQILVDRRCLADVGAVWFYEDKDQLTKESKNQKAEENEGSLENKKQKKAKQESLQEILTKLKGIVGDITRDASPENKAEGRLTQKLWKHTNLTIMKNEYPNKANTINDGKAFKAGIIYPVRMVAHNGEATYPQLSINNDIELTAELNKLLWKECESYIQAYLRGKTDVAFNVICADDKLISIQLISGKTSFLHHNVNILFGEKKKAELSEVLDVKAKGLVELLNTLNTNKNVIWNKKLTDEWYVRNGNIYLMKNVAGTDEVSGFNLNNLKSYIKYKKLLPTETKAKEKN